MTKIEAIPSLVSPIKMRGILTIHVKNAKNGAILRTIHKQNVITDDAGNVMRSLIAQRATDHAAAYLALGSMRFGTSSTTPLRSQTDLLAEVSSARKELEDMDKQNGSAGEIQFIATLQSADANGNTLREVGLFTTGTAWDGAQNPANGLYMFARQIHAPIEKTVALTLEYNWAIQFTV